MNIYEAQNFFNTIYGGNVSFDLNENGYRDFTISFTNGVPNSSQFITYSRLEVLPNGQSSFYFPINPHRVEIAFQDMQTLIAAMV